MTPALTFKVYDFTLGAGGVYRLPVSGAYFRIMSSTGAVNVTVEGVGTLPALQSGQALKNIPFNALIIQDASGAPNAGQILVASSEFQDNRLNGTVDLSAASLAALESVDLNPATINALNRGDVHSGFSNVMGALTANTAETIFNAGANPNGAILLMAAVSCYYGATFGQPSLLAKSTPPSSVTDGVPYLLGSLVNAVSGGDNVASGAAYTAQRIPAGLGLYWISSQNMPAATIRQTRFLLL